MNTDSDRGRVERDSLGEREIPAGALYGISTLRGAENFNISHRKIGEEPAFVGALATIKRASAAANAEIGALDQDKAEAIVAACDEIIGGRHHDQFIIDILEGSGGTSINMNTNEVVANRALQLLGSEPGDYGRLNPNDHVNLGQSTNDVVPSAVKLAVHAKAGGLIAALDHLAGALAGKASEFDDVLRIGRTCMQAAQPMMLGQAFGGYQAVVARVSGQLSVASNGLLCLPLGGTAIGTGLGCAPGFREAVFRHLADYLGKEVSPPGNMFDGMQNSDTFARVSSEARIAGEVIGKIASDLIILCSGPNSGLGEIHLPPTQAGSSIMPGKVNPVMPIMMQQVAFALIGNDASVSLASLEGQLEINHFEPIIASRMFESIDLLTRSSRLFADKCIAGIAANRDQSLKNLMDSSALSTAFVPQLGYAETARLVQQSIREQRPFVQTVIESGLLAESEVLESLRSSTQYQA